MYHTRHTKFWTFLGCQNSRGGGNAPLAPLIKISLSILYMYTGLRLLAFWLLYGPYKPIYLIWGFFLCHFSDKVYPASDWEGHTMVVKRAIIVTVTVVVFSHMFLGDSTATMPYCRIRWIAHTLQIAGCRDKRLLSLACKGRCESYTMYVPETDSIQRSCSCCQATGRSVRRVRMTCIDEGRGRYAVRLVQVALPNGCMCRPCSSESDRVPDMINPIEDRIMSVA